MLTLVSMLLSLGVAPFCGLVALVAFAACFARRTPKRAPSVAKMRHFTILVPAHDEAPVIAKTVQAVQGLNYPDQQVRLVVVADNCSDDTAKIAGAAGATVWERSHATERGKGYALRFAVDRFISGGEPTDAVVVIDADTRVNPELLNYFSWRLDSGASWVQAYYTTSNPDASWRTKLLTLALSLVNGVWLKGLDALGIGVLWRGNGMCCSFEALKRHPWEAHGLAEDIEFGWILRLAKERVRFCDGARVYGEMVSRGGDAATSQRQRWEHGRAVVRSQFRWRIIRASGISLTRKLFYLAELYMPSLSTLAVCVAVAFVAYIGAATGEFGELQRTTLSDLQALEAGALVFYLVSPFLVLGVPWRYLLSIRFLPAFMLWKLTLLVRRGPTGWVRTPREPSRD